MKVFVSHTMKDRQVAESVYSDLQSAGAQVYQFGESEALGGDAWERILTWISESDAFVVLLSPHTSKSKGVKAEIEHASYSYINTDRPGAMIPALVRAGAEIPVLVQRFTQLDLIDYRKGIAKLIAELRLKPAKRFPLKPLDSTATPFDSDAILASSRTASPLPRATELWARDATKILSNYKEAGPPDVPKEKETTFLDGILAEYSGKRRKPTALGDLGTFESRLRSAPTTTLSASTKADKSKATVSDLLLGFEKPKLGGALDAPKLEVKLWELTWTAVSTARSYVLESAADEQFSTPREVYRGSATRYFVLMDASMPRYYRVKALAGLLFTDSPWSNTVFHKAAQFLGGGPAKE